MNSTLDFGEFFRAVTGRPPFPFQRRFAEEGELPQLVCAPTGAGKTAMAIVGWLWRRFHADAAIRRSTPRRLVFCLPMRSLVKQTADAAEAFIEKAGHKSHVAVHRLLGGSVSNDWDSDPEGSAILVGTQDQLLSRALNRGYAMSRFRWPIHFALLHNDALWILDEVQLMGPGLSTSTQLEAFRHLWKSSAPARSVWMSATLDEATLATVDFRNHLASLRTLSLDDSDRKEPTLQQRLQAPKPIARFGSRLEKDEDTQILALAKAIISSHIPGFRTLAVVNRVQRAQKLFDAVCDAAPSQQVLLLHSRFRPADRRRIEDAALQESWQGILVATQAVEAGIDFSARALFTEIAPWSSMVQRFGRCNRRGEFNEREASITWMDLDDEHAAPYSPESLEESRRILSNLEDVSLQRLEQVKGKQGKPADPVIRRRDLLQLFDTQPDLAGADIDISRYVRDIGEGRDLQICWRSWTGDQPGSDEPEPHRDELCTVSIESLQTFLKKSRANYYRWNSLESAWEQPARLVPGMVVMLPLNAGGYSQDLGWTADKSDSPKPLILSHAPQDGDEKEILSYSCAEFVTLRVHSSDVAQEVRQLQASLNTADVPWPQIERAARWHDLGKVHPVWQKMITSSLAPNDVRHTGGPWAKSDGSPGTTLIERRHFRHELASALAFLQQGASDLEAYLVAAHHGKVRMSIRSRPGETPAPRGVRFALGVHEGDSLPDVDLGDGVVSKGVDLSLEVMELGVGSAGPSWAERTLALLNLLGPFRLAYYETLVRIADWRGTERRQATVSD